MIRQEIKLLIVDDHEIVRTGIRALLESQSIKYDFIIRESATPQDAIKKISVENYDIILLDYSFPETNGAKIARQMLSQKSDLKILTISNYDEYT
jgi:DNA-binding NarL/FixJ family response regulator